MERLQVDPHHPEQPALDRAAAVLRRGGLVAFPTETVYGLGANALDEAAVQRVFQAKGRPAFNPLIVHVADAARARGLAREWTDTARRLAEAFWPGPLTLVLPRADRVPPSVTAGLPDVAIRVPDHPVALGLLRAAALPLVAPSANPSSAVSPTRADHVVASLGRRVDIVLDGGPTDLGIESTVVGLAGERPILLRPGALGASDIEQITGPLDRARDRDSRERHASPGMLRRHYAPRARLVLFPPDRRDAAAAAARDAARAGDAVGALLLRPLDAPLTRSVPMPADPAGYARRLYDELHRMDAEGCDLILVEEVPESPAWEGVRDRLARATEAAPPGYEDAATRASSDP